VCALTKVITGVFRLGQEAVERTWLGLYLDKNSFSSVNVKWTTLNDVSELKYRMAELKTGVVCNCNRTSSTRVCQWVDTPMSKKGGAEGAVAPGRSRRGGAEQPQQNYFWPTNTKVTLYRSMNEPKVAYCNKLMLYWLSTCLSISYSTARHFRFQDRASHFPPKKGSTLHCFCCRALRTLVTPSGDAEAYSAAELFMGWVGLGRVGSRFSVFGGLGWVGSTTAKVLKNLKGLF